MINFRTSILFAGIVSISASEACTPKETESKKQTPNILFIAVDDLKPNLGCFGDDLAITPNIDRLAANGTIMASNYCQQAVCAPSRVSLFTGLRPDNTGVWDLQTFMRDVNPDVLTLPEYLKTNGYETAGFGKLIHGAKNNDPQSWSVPNKMDEDLVYAEGFKYPANGNYQSPEAQQVFLEAKSKKLNWRDTNILLRENNVAASMEFLDIPDDAYSDGAIAVEGMKLMESFSKSQKPFFLALGFHRPHLPFTAPKKYYDFYENTPFNVHPFPEHAKNSPELAYTTWGELRNYSDIPANGNLDEAKQLELIRAYYSAASYVDAQIGLVYDKLVELGLEKNTIIVLWGDHGWHLGDHGLWCKHTNFEQATKSPLIISAPGFQKEQISHSMTEFVDVFPTICELAGLGIPSQLEGQSLVPLLKNKNQKIKEYSMSQYPRGDDVMGYSLRSGNYRLTWWLNMDFRNISESPTEFKVDFTELYDYEVDPYETESKAGMESYKEVEAELSRMMLEYLKSQF
ncbi:MAG: sulfatase [Bacteroidales bacterium]|nr:sulfatase [Bacteroidales bacterium]MCF8391410.1 sulfatase [Bacteroidales bacterium]